MSWSRAGEDPPTEQLGLLDAEFRAGPKPDGGPRSVKVLAWASTDKMAVSDALAGDRSHRATTVAHPRRDSRLTSWMIIEARRVLRSEPN
jgi:hypothetical protein